MDINMDSPNENNLQFLDLKDLNKIDSDKIKEIIRLGVHSNALELPWDNGDKDYNSNSVVPETLESQERWQPYGVDESIRTFSVAGTTTSIVPPPLQSMNFAGSYVNLTYPQEWATVAGNAYTNSGTGDPTYQYMYGVPYIPQLYSPSEVINASPNRDNDRRGGRVRNRKNDTYNRVINSNESPSFLMTQGQFNSLAPMCDPRTQFISYGYSQHPVAGGSIYMPSQTYPHPPIHPSHNNHIQHSHPGYFTHPTGGNQKHTRQSSGHNYYNQDNMSKNTSNIRPKIHDKKVVDNNPTATQSFRQLPVNNSEYELTKKHKPIVTNNNENSTSVNNGHINVTVKKSTEIKEIEAAVTTPIVDVKFSADNCEIKNEETTNHVPVTPTSDIHDVIKLDEEIICTPSEQPVLPMKSSPIETTSSIIPKINGEDVKDDNTVVKKVVEVSTTVQEDKPHVNCESRVSPPTQTPPSYSSVTFASVVKKKNTDNHTSPIAHVNKSQIIQSSVSEPLVDVDNTIKNHQQNDGSKRKSVPFTLDNETSPITINNSAFSERKKSLKNSAQLRSHNPTVSQIREFLLNYQMEKHTVSLLPRGLTNRSNYCYINSILQALLACPPFYNLLNALPHSKRLSKNSTTPLTDNMIRFVKEFDRLSEAQRLPRKDLRAQKKSEDAAIDIQAGTAFEPSYVYTMLKNTSNAGVFSIEGRQEDAEEFLSCLLNGLSDEMLELMKQPNDDNGAPASVEPTVNYNNSDEEWKVMGPKNKGSITRCTEFGRTPLSDIFRGQLRSKILRQNDESTDNVQPFFTLQLDVDNINSVSDALEALVAKDKVEGMICSKTKQQINAWKLVTLEELPVILILHLKWFDYKRDFCLKIVKNVTYGIDLKLDSKLLSTTANKKLNAKQKQYKLFAVTYHDGKEASKGHYTTDAFHVGYGAWVRYDDSSVQSVSENEVLKPTTPRVPYLLYYRRCDTIGINQSNTTKTR